MHQDLLSLKQRQINNEKQVQEFKWVKHEKFHLQHENDNMNKEYWQVKQQQDDLVVEQEVQQHNSKMANQNIHNLQAQVEELQTIKAKIANKCAILKFAKTSFEYEYEQEVYDLQKGINKLKCIVTKLKFDNHILHIVQVTRI